VVAPFYESLYSTESSRLFDETYGSSYAQQFKNKDIPEGGSKESLLDLVVQPSVKNLIDNHREEEIIYLGPDKQIIPSNINWITNGAAQRGYELKTRSWNQS
jgi:glutamate dehydrogenase